MASIKIFEETFWRVYRVGLVVGPILGGAYSTRKAILMEKQECDKIIKCSDSEKIFRMTCMGIVGMVSGGIGGALIALASPVILPLALINTVYVYSQKI